MELEPVTREELFMAKAAGRNVETPEPCTRMEFFLQAIIDRLDAGGGKEQSTLAWKPSVDAAGNLSWELSESTDAPVTQNIKGATGAKGEKGDTGAQGPKGETGAAGKDGATGATGPQGPKGDKGETGAAGAKGADGKTPVKGVDYWTDEDKQEIVDAVLAASQTPQE